ncbi:MAG: glycerophosphodiester phosphodiesterase [Gammaproteobacteria bacterium]|nr:glycerophosphodiester phosphodiesterase [Gammaproteobacteria bacterium]
MSSSTCSLVVKKLWITCMGPGASAMACFLQFPLMLVLAVGVVATCRGKLAEGRHATHCGPARLEVVKWRGTAQPMHKAAILPLAKTVIQRRRFMSDLVVYGAPLSPFARKVLAACVAMLAPLAQADCVEVIAHRGASGYAPEHTLAAYALAYGQGAPWIEPDLILTADGVPIALHDLTLDRTTNVAEVFAGRARADGLHYAADFTIGELQRLAMVERRTGRFPHVSSRIPTLKETLDLIDGLNQTTGRRVGVIPELKHPAKQPGLGDATLKVLAAYDLPVRIQSFDAEALAALDTEHPRVLLIRHEAQLTPQGLDGIARWASGIGLPKSILTPAVASPSRHPPVISLAHERDLAVYAYTLRADQVGEPFTRFADEVTALAQAGVDALFTDHPDQALAALQQAGLRCR